MLNNQLDNILFESGKPYRGICAIKVVAKKDILNMPNYKQILESITLNTSFPIGSIELKPGKDFYHITKDFNIRASLEIATKTSNQGGPIFSYKLAFDFPNDTSARSNYLSVYDQTEMILVVTLKNKSTLVIGSLDRGADFTADYTSGSTFNGSNKYDAAFVIETSRRHFYAV